MSESTIQPEKVRKDCREAIRPVVEERRRRGRIGWIIYAVFCVSILPSFFGYPMAGLVGLGITSPILLGWSLYRQPLTCPSCSCDAQWEKGAFCPECGAGAVGAGGFLSAPRCGACGTWLGSYKGAPRFVVRYCRGCGAYLDENGLR